VGLASKAKEEEEEEEKIYFECFCHLDTNTYRLFIVILIQ
jgi:hypothetical protein